MKRRARGSGPNLEPMTQACGPSAPVDAAGAGERVPDRWRVVGASRSWLNGTSGAQLGVKESEADRVCIHVNPVRLKHGEGLWSLATPRDHGRPVGGGESNAAGRCRGPYRPNFHELIEAKLPHRNQTSKPSATRSDPQPVRIEDHRDKGPGPARDSAGPVPHPTNQRRERRLIVDSGLPPQHTESGPFFRWPWHQAKPRGRDHRVPLINGWVGHAQGHAPLSAHYCCKYATPHSDPKRLITSPPPLSGCPLTHVHRSGL